MYQESWMDWKAGYDEETGLTEPLLSDKEEQEKDLSTDVITPTEASWQIGVQVFFPYIIAGLGMVAAGIVLDIVQVGQKDTCENYSIQ